MSDSSCSDRNFVLLHGLLVDADAERPRWTHRELVHWLLWRWRAKLPGRRPAGDRVVQLWEATMAPLPGLSAGSVFLSVDFSFPRLTYSRNLPEIGTVLNVEYLLRPAGGPPEALYPVQPWWRRFERLRIAGKAISPTACDDLCQQMPGPIASLVRWELEQVRWGWQRLNNAASRGLGNHWVQYCRACRFGTAIKSTPERTPIVRRVSVDRHCKSVASES